MNRRVALVVAAAVTVASLLPLLWPEGTDDFPLTSYPMFSDRRPDADVVLVLALGEAADDTVVLPTEATGHRHVTQADKALRAAVAAGGDHPQRLCADIAQRVVGATDEGVEHVRIVTAAFDGVTYLTAGKRTPAVLAEHARCRVNR